MGVVQSTEYIYNVTDDGRSFVVRLKNKTCSCGKFQDEEIPCEHVWVVLKRKKWIIPEAIMYDEVRPPKFKRPPERPKNKPRSKTKRKLLGLKGKHTCSTSGFASHNRPSCRNRPREV
ncbi:uncharacterized protein [Solanum lycopersicum]|uniref:uncharacterized protein n=1 Tax=Solanum lycopersicum TaxID=4081 RepID=UPI0037489BEF